MTANPDCLLWTPGTGWSMAVSETVLEGANKDPKSCFSTGRFVGQSLLLSRYHFRRIEFFMRHLKMADANVFSETLWNQGMARVVDSFHTEACRFIVYRQPHDECALGLVPRSLPPGYWARRHGVHVHLRLAPERSEPQVKWMDREVLNQVTVTCDDPTGMPCETLLVDREHNVLEGVYSNVLIRKGGKWRTPCPQRFGILNGVAVQSFSKEALIAGETLEFGEIQIRDLTEADECWLTNALVGAVPVTQIDDTVLERHDPSECPWLEEWRNLWPRRA